MKPEELRKISDQNQINKDLHHKEEMKKIFSILKKEAELGRYSYSFAAYCLSKKERDELESIGYKIEYIKGPSLLDSDHIIVSW